MSAVLACPHCKAPLAADPDLVGHTVPCYLCHQPFEVRAGLNELRTANTAPPLTVIDVIENYLGGEPFDIEAAERLCEVPLDHLAPLFNDLNVFYGDWLENQVEARWEHAGPNDFHLFVPYPPEYAIEEHAQQCKKMLLYLPRITWHDPLADEVLPAFYAARFTRVVDEAMLQNAVNTGFRSLALLTPLVKSGDLTLVPHAAVLNYAILQLRAQAEVEQTSKADRDKLFAQIPSADPAVQTASRFGLDAVFDASKVWGHFCTLMRYTPVACDLLVRELMANDYLAPSAGRIPQIEHRVATSLFQYNLPGVAAMPLDRLIALRGEVDAFKAWRLGIAEFMDVVYKENPQDIAQQKVELQQAGEAILRPKVESLTKEIKGSSFLEKIALPGVVAASSVMVTWHLTDNVPISTGISGVLSTGTWVFEKIRHQFSRKARKASAIREVYNMMLDATSD